MRGKVCETVNACECESRHRPLGAPVSKDELQLNTVGSKDSLALLLKASYSSSSVGVQPDIGNICNRDYTAGTF